MPDEFERLRIARDSFKDLAAENAIAADRYAKENSELRSSLDAAVAERDEALTIQSPEDVLEPQWGHNAFRSVLGESYKPKVWSKDRALNYASLREALAIEGLPDRAHDVIAALIWNRVVVGNNAHHAWKQRDAALARAERAEKALEASAYLTSRYRDCWLGKTVRDLPEAEAAYVSANAAVVAAALAHPATAEET